MKFENFHLCRLRKKVPVLLQCLVVMAILMCGCKHKHEESAGKVDEDITMKDKAIEIASEKAKELGYSLDKMELKVTRDGNFFVVYFGPKEMVLGGDLTVKIDSTTWQIVDIQRGQ